MKQIKIDATESTNDYLKQMLRQVSLEDGTVVRTLNQTKGRGQRGANWFFEKDKSLAFSILKKWLNDKPPNPFHLQWVVTNSIFEVLSDLGRCSWHIKWPNDIMADGKKIAGILIEHQYQNKLQSSVIGIGINVNNQLLPTLPQAASLSTILGRKFDVDLLCDTLWQKLFLACSDIKQDHYSRDLEQLNQRLYRKNIPTFFETAQQGVFQGQINGVDQQGRLVVDSVNGLQAHNVGEIRLIAD